MSPYLDAALSTALKVSRDDAPDMQAMWLREPGKFELQSQPRYTVGADEALVQISYCGICPWDLRVYAGKQ